MTGKPVPISSATSRSSFVTVAFVPKSHPKPGRTQTGAGSKASLLSPPPFSQWQFLPLGGAAPVHLGLPRPVLAQPGLGVRRVVEVDIGDGRLDERPDTPVEAWDSAVEVDLVGQFLDLGCLVVLGLLPGEEAEVRPYKLGDELTPLGLGGQHIVVTVKTTPFGKVVAQIECCRGGHGIFIVNKGHGLIGAICGAVADYPGVLVAALGQNNDIPAQQVAMREDQLGKVSSGLAAVPPGWSWTITYTILSQAWPVAQLSYQLGQLDLQQLLPLPLCRRLGRQGKDPLLHDGPHVGGLLPRGSFIYGVLQSRVLLCSPVEHINTVHVHLVADVRLSRKTGHRGVPLSQPSRHGPVYLWPPQVLRMRDATPDEPVHHAIIEPCQQLWCQAMLREQLVVLCFPSAIDDQVGAVAVCAQQDGLPVDLVLGQARALVDGLEQRVCDAIGKAHELYVGVV